MFGKRKRGKNGKVGPPVPDDLVGRDFTAERQIGCGLPITEHHTSEGQLCLCAIKDVFSNRIVGYNIDSRMKVTPLPRGRGRRCRAQPTAAVRSVKALHG